MTDLKALRAYYSRLHPLGNVPPAVRDEVLGLIARCEAAEAQVEEYVSGSSWLEQRAALAKAEAEIAERIRDRTELLARAAQAEAERDAAKEALKQCTARDYVQKQLEDPVLREAFCREWAAEDVTEKVATARALAFEEAARWHEQTASLCRMALKQPRVLVEPLNQSIKSHETAAAKFRALAPLDPGWVQNIRALSFEECLRSVVAGRSAGETRALAPLDPSLVAIPAETLAKARGLLVNWFEGGRPYEATERMMGELSAALALLKQARR